jgi:hypothetical protein
MMSLLDHRTFILDRLYQLISFCIHNFGQEVYFLRYDTPAMVWIDCIRHCGGTCKICENSQPM